MRTVRVAGGAIDRDESTYDAGAMYEAMRAMESDPRRVIEPPGFRLFRAPNAQWQVGRSDDRSRGLMRDVAFSVGAEGAALPTGLRGWRVVDEGGAGMTRRSCAASTRRRLRRRCGAARRPSTSLSRAPQSGVFVEFVAPSTVDESG